MIKINVFYIFEMIVRTIQLAKELVNKELHMFWMYQVNAKDIKCPLPQLGKCSWVWKCEIEILIFKRNLVSLMDIKLK
jgi:hypothetical protein